MAVAPVVLPTSGHAAWDDLATWWLSRYKISTQQTYATYLPRWTAWCAGRGLNPLQAGRADVELWLRTVADSGPRSRRGTAFEHPLSAHTHRRCRLSIWARRPFGRVHISGRTVQCPSLHHFERS
jgi:integrase/recombinase XerC/integrase/recombinase XerD